jgi:predicted amidohydrolase YtcJ
MKFFTNKLPILLGLILSPLFLLAQDSSVVDYPDMIIYNSKIVTMDDASFSSDPGSIFQAIAVRNDTILALGNNQEIRALAGPSTKQIDLKGRTILPSFILTHGHPTDRIWEAGGYSLRHVLPEGNEHMVIRFLKGTAEEQIASWESVLQEAVETARPGQWILISTNWGGNYEDMPKLLVDFWRHITVERLDELAPNNPVRIKNSTVDGLLNTRGEEEAKKVFPTYTARGNRGPTGRMLEPDVMLHNKVNINADLLEAELELWTAHGITTFGSAPYTINNLQALTLLDREKRMTGRFGWSYTGPDLHYHTLRLISALLGSGSDYLWNIGAHGEFSGGNCTTLPASDRLKSIERCNLEPGTAGRRVKEDIVRSGGRIAAMHSGGDKDIDHLLDIIEEQSKAAGMTLEQIRERRHGFDHASGAPRPDQIPRIKRLGMMISMLNTMLWENNRGYDASYRVKNYGEEYAQYIVPRNSVTKAGIMNTQEIDRPLPHYMFYNIWVGMTRYNEACERYYAKEEGTDLVTQLKATTIWGAYYLLREDRIGSLEPGKLADFVVLDRDILTIPEDDIPQTKVLMTVLGGKTLHLLPGLANELDMAPAGPTTWPSKPLETRFVFKGPPKVCPAIRPDGFPGRI